jgi:hypothetical protein
MASESPILSLQPNGYEHANGMSHFAQAEIISQRPQTRADHLTQSRPTEVGSRGYLVFLPNIQGPGSHKLQDDLGTVNRILLPISLIALANQANVKFFPMRPYRVQSQTIRTMSGRTYV